MTTLTSQITLDMGNTVSGAPWNEVLWTMGLILLCISIAFVLLVRTLGRRRSAHDARRRDGGRPLRTAAIAAADGRLPDRIATAGLWAIGIFVVLILVAIIAHFMLAASARSARRSSSATRATPSVGGVGPDPLELALHARPDAADHGPARHARRDLHGRVRRRGPGDLRRSGSARS